MRVRLHQLPEGSPPRPSAGSTAPGMRPGDWFRTAAMGLILAALVYIAFFYRPTSAPAEAGSAVEAVWDATPVPQLDPSVLAQVRDATGAERLILDEAPLAHLLEKSLAVTPAAARKLGMPEQPLSVAKLRANPASHRGLYLWAKGKLEYLSHPKPGHPVPGYHHYEARVRTDAGEPLVFSFSVPPPEGIELGSWVRIEGFFMKLIDDHLPVELERTPLLVGPELLAAYPDWEAVDQLDPAVLARVQDGEWKGGSTFEGGPDIDKMLADSQDVPLWHLASFALHGDKATDEQWRQVPAFSTVDQFEAFRRGEVARGAPMRVLGTFVHARVMPAEVNPLGIEAWTEVWLQVRDLGGKTVPVWIPRRISAEWQQNQSAIVRGYFFKRYRYETRQGDQRWTPLFVAADMRRFELPGDAMTNPFTYALAGLLGLVIAVFFVLSRRDRKQRAKHESELVQRRRRRRAVAQA